MEYLQSLLENSHLPIMTAAILGLLTAMSPCPMATNITAIGYIGRDIQNRKKVFTNGLYYTLGTVVGYTVLGVILIVALQQGATVSKFQRAFTTWSELLTGPLIIIIGILMLRIFRINISFFTKLTEKAEKRINYRSSTGAFFLGILFAMAFCPNTAVLYFGGLIPLAVTAKTGYFLPAIFAITTALPVCFFAWLIAYSVAGVGKFYNRLTNLEKWFRLSVAILFILVGGYLTWLAHFYNPV